MMRWLFSLALLAAAIAANHGAAQEARPSPAFNSHACKKDAAGKLYVAFMRAVFAFPRASLETDDLEPSATENGAWPRWTWARPVPPDPSQPSGCPDNPEAVFGYGLDDATVDALLGFPWPFEAQSLGPRVTLEASDPDSLWVGSCGGPELCDMQCHTVNGSVRNGCMVRTFLQPGIFLRYNFTVAGGSDRVPVDRFNVFDKSLRAGLIRSEVPHYPWRATARIERVPPASSPFRR